MPREPAMTKTNKGATKSLITPRSLFRFVIVTLLSSVSFCNAFELEPSPRGKTSDAAARPQRTASRDHVSTQNSPQAHRRSIGRVLRLGLCEGGCSSDNDCEDGLTCYQRVGDQDEVPGCPDDMEAIQNYCVDSTHSAVIITFSLIRTSPPLNASDVVKGRAPKIVDSVSNALIEIFCTHTNFLVVDTVDDMHINMCNRGQNLQDIVDSAPIISANKIVKVQDRKSDELAWILWTMPYPIVQVGLAYLSDSAHDEEPNAQSSDGVNEMQKIASLAVSNSIHDKTFDSLIGNGVRTSVTGEENSTFAVESEAQELKRRHIEPFNNMRIAGIILFVANILFVWVLQRQSQRRQQARIRDSKRKVPELGGISTLERVNHMLDEGRRISQIDEVRSLQKQRAYGEQRGLSTEDGLDSVLEASRNNPMFKSRPKMTPDQERKEQEKNARDSLDHLERHKFEIATKSFSNRYDEHEISIAMELDYLPDIKRHSSVHVANSLAESQRKSYGGTGRLPVDDDMGHFETPPAVLTRSQTKPQSDETCTCGINDGRLVASQGSQTVTGTTAKPEDVTPPLSTDIALENGTRGSLANVPGQKMPQREGQHGSHRKVGTEHVSAAIERKSPRPVVSCKASYQHHDHERKGLPSDVAMEKAWSRLVAKSLTPIIEKSELSPGE